MTATRLSFGALLLALLLIPFADLEIAASNPGAELARMGGGLIAPQLADLGILGTAVVQTFAFGVLGTLLAAPIGLLLALLWDSRFVRTTCASLRAIHELFWALLLLQVFGLSPWTGLLALAIPYSAIFAKVFAEILSEQPDDALQALPPQTSPVARWLFIRLPTAWPQMKTYLLTRAECGLRSSAVLGFIGLPTLGYHLEGALSYGAYNEAAVFLLALIALIGGFRLLLPAWSWPLWLLGLPWLLPDGGGWNSTALLRLLTEDLWPTALHNDDWAGVAAWLGNLTQNAIIPGMVNTLLLSVLALVATGAATLLLWPLATRKIGGWVGWTGGQTVVLVMRAMPEYLLAYVLVLVWGPSMLPAIVALMLHNAAIIAFLLSRSADRLDLRLDAPTGLNLYQWEILPRLYGPFLAYLFYRWEIILRESAVVGLLGVYTLGFYIDSALAELRLDRLLPLLFATVLLNIFVDAASRRLRQPWSFSAQTRIAAVPVG